jgi:hypothetical protein
LLELKVLENICASSRQSKSTKTCDVLRYLKSPVSVEHGFGQDTAVEMDWGKKRKLFTTFW